jgi:hypothetical protein
MGQVKRLFFRFFRYVEKGSQEKANREMKTMGYSVQSLRPMDCKEK